MNIPKYYVVKFSFNVNVIEKSLFHYSAGP